MSSAPTPTPSQAAAYRGIYNKGGHVVHIAVKVSGEDSWAAFSKAGELAQKIGGEVTAVYHDNKYGARTHVLSVELGGLEIGRRIDELAAAARVGGVGRDAP